MALKVKGIEGFYLIPNVFDQEENQYYISKIEENKGFECKQIHLAEEYGWKFLPVEKKTQQDYLGPNPPWLNDIWSRASSSLNKYLGDKNFTHWDHVLINHYEVGDGCKPHTDDLKFWDDWVIGVSFGSGCEMILSEYKTNNPTSIYLPAKSVYLLTGDARYRWTHGISFKSGDKVYGDLQPRTKRISLTFRTISLEYLDPKVKLI